jgi:hypothetical protein
MNKDVTRGKKVLPAVFGSDYVHIPHLRKKLKWLYGRNLEVDTQYKLAEAMDVSPATMTKWLQGTEFEDDRTIAPLNPESIPVKKFRRFVEIWGLPETVLLLEDLTEFRDVLAKFQAGHSAWDKFVDAAADSDCIEIIANDSKRGIIDPDDEEYSGILHFEPNDEILIRVANPGLRHGIMLLQDRFGWTCLRPSVRWKETEIGDTAVFPRQIANEAPRFARLDTVGGVHRVLVIFIAEPLPASVLDILLARPIDLGSLNNAAPFFQNLRGAGSDHFCMFVRRFLVATRGS